jgi:ornithine carbamoyltransferase
MGNKRDFLSLWDVTETEFAALIRRAEELRFLRQVRTPHATRPGRVVALILKRHPRGPASVSRWPSGNWAVTRW